MPTIGSCGWGGIVLIWGRRGGGRKRRMVQGIEAVAGAAVRAGGGGSRVNTNLAAARVPSFADGAILTNERVLAYKKEKRN